MGNLLASLLTSAGAMRTFERALQVVQNNVANASTPGYARARLSLSAMPFDPNTGLGGGVMAGELESARDEYAERAVRLQEEYYGRSAQSAQDLAQLEQIFNISGDAGIPGALTALFQGFTRLAALPNDMQAREQVIDRAAQVASNFNQTSAALNSLSQSAERQIRDVVDRINELAAQIREINTQGQQTLRSKLDAGVDAQLHNTLEELAELVDFTVLKRDNGCVDIYLGGGQAPLVMGDRQLPLEVDYSGGETLIRAAGGATVDALISRGKLSGLLDTRNNLIPSYQTELDRLAQTFADQVNGVLAAGVDTTGASGKALFSYDLGVGAAATVAVTDITPAELAAAAPEAPGGNANALSLAALAGSRQVDGYTFTEFYGSLAGRIGRERTAARESQQTHEQLMAQARSLRAEMSGVSLDEEAVRLIEFQRAYQASAQLISVLNGLTETVLGLLR